MSAKVTLLLLFGIKLILTLKSSVNHNKLIIQYKFKLNYIGRFEQLGMVLFLKLELRTMQCFSA